MKTLLGKALGLAILIAGCNSQRATAPPSSSDDHRDSVDALATLPPLAPSFLFAHGSYQRASDFDAARACADDVFETLDFTPEDDSTLINGTYHATFACPAKPPID